MLKLPISAGLPCPNRIGADGCLFCAADGAASPTACRSTDIRAQMHSAREGFRRADAETRYIAYFQAYTNTNAPVEMLRDLYDTALSEPNIIGLMIATRPDCLPDTILDLIASYAKEGFELWLEIGMQTMHERGLVRLNRGHTHAQTREAINRAAARRIPVCAHLILGIPGEDWNDMMDTAVEASSLPVRGVKIHHLHVIKGTGLEALYREGRLRLFSFKEYVSTICDFLERLRRDILIHRVLGDRPRDTLVAPEWGLYKGTVHRAIDEEFIRRGTHQGFLYEGPET